MRRKIKRNEEIGFESVEVFDKKNNKIILDFIKKMGFDPSDVSDFRCSADIGLMVFVCVKEIRQ